jgi:hypothetical protein
LTCSSCRLPFARIHNGVLIIQSRHHGQPHVNVISLSDLVRLLEASQVALSAVARASLDSDAQSVA